MSQGKSAPPEGPQGEILVTPEVYGRLQDATQKVATDKGTVTMEGKREKTPVYTDDWSPAGMIQVPAGGVSVTMLAVQKAVMKTTVSGRTGRSSSSLSGSSRPGRARRGSVPSWVPSHRTSTS